jgi:hypothetical protein
MTSMTPEQVEEFLSAPPLLVDREAHDYNLCPWYTGDLEAGKRLVARDRFVHEGGGVGICNLCHKHVLRDTKGAWVDDTGGDVCEDDRPHTSDAETYFYVHLCDDEAGESIAEFGYGSTAEEAWRWAIGAACGPIDADYDEAHLLRMIRKEQERGSP